MNLYPLILTAVIFLLIGIAAGMLFSALRAGPAPAEPAAPEPVEPAALLTLRREAGGALLVELDETRLTPGAGLQPLPRARLEALQAELAAWLGGAAPAQPAPPEAVAPVGVETAGAAPPVQAAPPPAEGAPETAPPARRQTLTPFNVISRALQGDVGVPKPVLKSIVTQIDEVLQVRLAGTPLAGRGVKLMELPGKGMVVMVGLEQYDSVEAVPDAQVREAIRQAAAAWESSGKA
jgi:hypothetical protein